MRIIKNPRQVKICPVSYNEGFWLELFHKQVGSISVSQDTNKWLVRILKFHGKFSFPISTNGVDSFLDAVDLMFLWISRKYRLMDFSSIQTPLMSDHSANSWPYLTAFPYILVLEVTQVSECLKNLIRPKVWVHSYFGKL